PAASRFHAQIELKQGNYVLSDLNSTNGTFVNGNLIFGGHTLTVGDAIRIGPTQLVFNVDETLLQTNEEGNLRDESLAKRLDAFAQSLVENTQKLRGATQREMSAA
ncbi:MAG: FHA domain-containing protein, partial [Leptolyngbyaceae cyanobacterium RM2_2_4]|nr:FHA domain-containing protein [Leptolyngbyaceae cyanobacterium RM2_2_4]